MSRIALPGILVKVGLAPGKPKFHAAATAGQSVLPQLIVMTPAVAAAKAKFEKHPAEPEPPRLSPLKRGLGYMHRYSLGMFAILFLLVGVSAIQVAAAYRSSQIVLPATTANSRSHRYVTPLHGPNIVIPADQLTPTVERITTQPINLTIGTKTVPVEAATIKSWLQIVTDKGKKTSYVHLKESAIGPSLNDITSKFAKAPVNQVTVTHPDGSSAVIAAGRNGVGVGDTSELAKQIAPNVLGGKGMQLNIPLQPIPFQSVTAANFDKLIEVNVVTKQMYLYDKGQFTRSYPISAGAPATPTPIGQFKIYSKPVVQDMKGFNPDGSKYLQPNVHWINYFLPGGYAIHGNYWRPTSWFGAINSSHGCVSLPDAQAKQVYDWAPIGTTVITHY